MTPRPLATRLHDERPDPRTAPRLRVAYEPLTADDTLGPDVLAAIAFGMEASPPRDPRCVRVPLGPVLGAGLVQVWTGVGPVRLGQTGIVRHTEDGTHLMGWIEVDEDAHGGLVAAAEAAYRELLGFHAESRYRHVWRIWNFVGDINAGSGDDERYRQFCLGRARAFERAAGRAAGIGYPAATAVGTVDGRRRLSICWLAGAVAGQPVENPRQVSAFRYPRQYGPAAPSFSRAMLTPGDALLVSGTASIVGHGSLHHGDAGAQLEETLRNLDALAAAASAPTGSRAVAAPLLTVFLRRPVDPARIVQRLQQHYPANTGIVVLDADICRAELLLEIEAIG
jgi:chorismate lyase/3-hydroxybenzoate synthase